MVRVSSDMLPPRICRVSAALFLLVLVIMVPVSAASSPYSFTVSPVTASGKPGDMISYSVTITGSQGFNSPIDFTMDVGSLGYSRTLNLGTYKGPYPKSFTYVLTIPDNVPTGVSADVTVKGKSGTYSEQQSLKLKIKGEGGPVEDIIGAFTDLINTAIREISKITGTKN
jgi:hypothetical protein